MQSLSSESAQNVRTMSLALSLVASVVVADVWYSVESLEVYFQCLARQ